MMDLVDRLRELFQKRGILEISAIMRLLGATTRMTAYRYLKRLNYLSSYSHNGKFYTLEELITFDEVGLCHLGDVGFSKYGTLSDTLVHVIEHAECGKTSSELEHQYRVRVKNTLLNLTKAKRIRREKLKGKVFVYLNPELAARQQQARRKQKTPQTLPDWVIFEILVETIRASSQVISADTVAARLQKRGSHIRKGQVQQVFEKYELEKKTSDSVP